MGPNMKLLEQDKKEVCWMIFWKVKHKKTMWRSRNQGINMFSFVWLSCVLGIYACAHTYI